MSTSNTIPNIEGLPPGVTLRPLNTQQGVPPGVTLRAINKAEGIGTFHKAWNWLFGIGEQYKNKTLLEDLQHYMERTAQERARMGERGEMSPTATGFDVLAPNVVASTIKTYRGMMSPKNAALGVTAAVLPPARLPIGAYYAVTGAEEAMTPQQQEETPPEELERRLGGAASAAGGLATMKSSAVPVKNMVRSATRSYMGIGPRQATRAVTGAMAEHAADVTKVQDTNAVTQAKYETAQQKTTQRQATINAETAESNRVAQQEHAQAVAKVEEINKAGQEAVGRRNELSSKITTDSTQIGEDIRGLESRVRAVGSSKYEAVSKAIGDDTIPASDMAPVVHHAQENLLAGSSESIKQFSDLLRRSEPQDVPTSMGTAHLGDPLYDILVKEGAVQPTERLSFRDLQGYYTELGQKMQGASVPGDVYRAMKYVREQIGQQMQAMAEKHGVGAGLTDARNYWKQYEQTFHDMRPVARGGSPVARSLRASDPGYVAAPLLGKASARAVTMLNAYDANIGKSAAQLATDFNEMKSLPAKFKPKETPTAPTPKVERQLEMPKPPQEQPLPEAPDLNKTIVASREKRLSQISSNFRRPSAWDISIIGALYRHGLGAWLDNPRVVSWLSEPLPKDLAALDKLPDRARAEVQDTLAKAYIRQAQQGSPVTLPDSIRRFLQPIQVQEIEGAQSNTSHVVGRNGQITLAHVAQENNYYTQARFELGANATPSQVLQRAQQLKTQARVQPPAPPSMSHQALREQLGLVRSRNNNQAAIASIMLALKRGDLTQQEADQRIQRLNGGGGRKLVRMPPRP